jgi:hypothetical protein
VESTTGRMQRSYEIDVWEWEGGALVPPSHNHVYEAWELQDGIILYLCECGEMKIDASDEEGQQD